MAKGKKQKVDFKDLSQTHGALNNFNVTKQFNRLGSDYETDSFQEYSSMIHAMENADLFNHSATIGQAPIDDREKLIRRLEDLFLTKQAQNFAPYKLTK